MTPDIVVILSTHTNAVGIARSLRGLGWKGEVVCVAVGSETGEAIYWPKLCRVLETGETTPHGVLAKIGESLSKERIAAVYLTNEAYHEVLESEVVRKALFPNARIWLGANRDVGVVVDRKVFYDYLITRSLATVPHSISATADPFATFSEFRVRPWRSYSGVTRNHRGANIRSREEWEIWLRAHGSNLTEFGCQELLSTNPKDCVSVCGWHSGDLQMYLPVRRLVEEGENSMVVQVDTTLSNLCEVARRILTSLSYQGPFELEFLKGQRDADYRVIELNPRFWLQHRLFGNRLASLYLGLPATSWAFPECRRWVDSRWAMGNPDSIPWFWWCDPTIQWSLSLRQLFASRIKVRAGKCLGRLVSSRR